MSSNGNKRRLSRKSIVRDTQVIRDLLGAYLEKFIIQNQGNSFLYLSKPNIKLLSLFILSTIKLDESEKRKLYQVLLKTSNIDNDHLKIFFSILDGIVDLYPIIYDGRQLNMLDFISSNYINILCEYNGRENSPLILFNVRKILSDMFDNNSNIIDLFRGDTYLFENVFRSGNDKLKYVNKKKYHTDANVYNRNNRYSRSSSRNSSRNSSRRSYTRKSNSRYSNNNN